MEKSKKLNKGKLKEELSNESIEDLLKEKLDNERKKRWGKILDEKYGVPKPSKKNKSYLKKRILILIGVLVMIFVIYLIFNI